MENMCVLTGGKSNEAQQRGRCARTSDARGHEPEPPVAAEHAHRSLGVVRTALCLVRRGLRHGRSPRARTLLSAILWQIFLIPKHIQEACAMQAKAAVLYEAGTPLRLEE